MDIKLQEKLCNIRQDDKNDITLLVCEMAASIFEEIGCPDDYCIQDISGYRVIFGGLNRVVFTPFDGFWADQIYCTANFLDKFDSAVEKLRQDI